MSLDKTYWESTRLWWGKRGLKDRQEKLGQLNTQHQHFQQSIWKMNKCRNSDIQLQSWPLLSTSGVCRSASQQNISIHFVQWWGHGIICYQLEVNKINYKHTINKSKYYHNLIQHLLKLFISSLFVPSSELWIHIFSWKRKAYGLLHVSSK